MKYCDLMQTNLSDFESVVKGFYPAKHIYSNHYFSQPLQNDDYKCGKLYNILYIKC